MKTKLIIAALALAVLGFTSCNSDSGPAKKSFIDIVTLDSNSPSGAVMSFNKIDSSPEIVLTTSEQLPDQYFKAGTRILIIYQTPSDQQYVSGACTVLQAGNVFGNGYAPAPAVVDTLDNWKSSPIEIIEKWRSGAYVNFSTTVDAQNAPKKFVVYYDATTLDNEYPEFHILYEPASGPQGGQITYYSSYRISEFFHNQQIRGNQQVRGLKFKYQSNSGEKEFIIERPAESTITPAN